MIRKLITAIQISKVMTLVSRREHDDALDMLLETFHRYGEARPTYATPIVSNVLYADLCERMGRMEDAFYAAKIAIHQIGAGSDPDNVKYKTYDFDYMLYRCKWILSRTSRHTDSEAFLLASSIPVIYEQLDIGSTKSMLRTLFPVTSEDGHQLDAFFRNNRNSGDV
jgi:hypothetical protein